MLLLWLLMIYPILAIPQNPFNMYNVDSYHDGYCLSSFDVQQTDKIVKDYFTVRQVTSFCLRILEDDDFLTDFNIHDVVDHNFTFAELKELNITSQMLLSWSAATDLAEDYEIFLHNNLNSSSDSRRLFYNCTSSWFGPFCRFTFDYKMDQTFDDIIAYILAGKTRFKDAKLSCYEHLHVCKTLLSCLDWHAICDGKNDCLDGSDEYNCWQLEINECTKDEYRCQNGQCIPIEFLHDNSRYPDCLDRTDEFLEGSNVDDCATDHTFQCEEHTCRSGVNDFSCDDGECTNGIRKCYNGRSSLLSGDFCSNATGCSIYLTDHIGPKWCKKFCSKSSCIKDNCPDLYEFRSMLPIFGHVRFLYSNKEVEGQIIPLPEYVCYDEKRCADFLPVTERINNLTCRRFNDLGLQNIHLYDNILTVIKHIKQRFWPCLISTYPKDYCNYSSMYQCINSSKCISKQRIVDGIQDCPYNDDETYNQSCSLTDTHQRSKMSR